MEYFPTHGQEWNNIKLVDVPDMEYCPAHGQVMEQY